MVGRRVVVVTNPTAGRGRGAAARVATLQRLDAAGFEVDDVRGADADETLDRARAAVTGHPSPPSALVVVGGDGLVNLGLQVVAGTPVALGIVACGTGNDAARTLDLPRDDPRAAADRVVAALATGRRRRLDLARCGGRWFITVLAAGFDAAVNERANRMTRPRGQARYTLATASELRTFRPRSYVLDLDGETRRLEATLVAVGNGPSYGGGLRITEGARLDDGLLDVVVIRPVSRRELARTYPRLFRGTHTDHPAYEHHRARVVTLAAADIVAYADGERFGALPLTVEAVPGALEALA